MMPGNGSPPASKTPRFIKRGVSGTLSVLLTRQQHRFRCKETEKPWSEPETPDLLEGLGSEEGKKQPSLKFLDIKILLRSYPISAPVKLTKC
jgi:hypothetical protein